jgi:hypothetical protein
MTEDSAYDPRLPWSASLRNASLAALRAKSASATVAELRRYGHDYCCVNLLAVLGDTKTPEQIRALAGDCMRRHLLFGEEFHAYCLAARGKRSWDSEMRELHAGIRLTAHAKSTLQALLSRGSIITCGFHWGAFRFIPFGVSSLGVQVKSVLGEQGVERYGSYFEFDHDDISEMRARGVPEDYYRVGTVGTHKSSEMLRALRTLRSSPSALFIPVDGMFTRQRSGNSVEISFAGLELEVKANPARLAASLEVPLVALFAAREDTGAMTVDVAGVIEPDRARTFPQRAMERLYRTLEQHVKSFPEQWEGARTFHHWRRVVPVTSMERPSPLDAVAIRERVESGRLCLNDSRIVCVHLSGGDRVWVDSRTLRCFGKSPEAREILDSLGDPVAIARLWQQSEDDEQRRNSLVYFLAKLYDEGLVHTLLAEACSSSALSPFNSPNVDYGLQA